QRATIVSAVSGQVRQLGKQHQANACDDDDERHYHQPGTALARPRLRRWRRSGPDGRRWLVGRRLRHLIGRTIAGGRRWVARHRVGRCPTTIRKGTSRPRLNRLAAAWAFRRRRVVQQKSAMWAE